MADDLKRVGLVFKADGTTDFQKSLTTINSLTKESYANFKLAQSQYDKNTSSLTRLKNQQQYLSQNTELYKNKVSVLEEELKNLENAETRNEKAISNKRAQLANAQATLNKYEKGLRDVNAQIDSGSAQLKEYAENVKEASEKFSNAGKTMTKNVTAPIAAVGTASMVAWNEIDEAYDNIILKTGATGEALDSLKGSFDNVYGTMPVDSNVVSEAIGEVNTRFKVTGKELESLSKYMIEFAEITGSDVTEATGYAQKIQGQWNLSIDETKNVLGLVAKQSQDTGISVDTLMSSVTANSSTFKEMDLNVYDAVNLMAQFESAGLEADGMLTGLKKASQKYASEGKNMNEGLTDLVKRLQDSTTYQEAYNEVVDLFGSKNALAFATAAKEGKINLEDLSSSLGNYTNVVKDTFEGTLDPVDKGKEALNNLKIVGTDLADTIQGTLAPAFEGVANALKDFSNWFKELDPTIKTILVIIAGIVASIGPLLVIIGALGSQISNGLNILADLKLALFESGGMFNTLTSAISGLSAPILAVIGVIALITTAIIDLWNTNEQFRQNVISIVNNIISIVQNLYTSVLAPIINAIIVLIGTIWETCIKPLYENVKSFISEVINIVSNLLDFLTPIINTIVDLLGVIVTNVLKSVLLPAFKTVFSTIGTVIQTCFNLISTLYNGVLKPVFDVIVNIIKNIVLPAFTIVFAGICTVVTATFNGIKSVYNSILKPCFDTISSAIKILQGTFSSVWNGIKKTTTNVWNGIKSAITSPMESAKKLIKGIIDAIKGFFNFKISWPKIPLPHFSVKPKGWGIGDLLKGKIPSLGIDWYAKAMDTPMALDNATIFGMSNGNLLGGGEKGTEYITGEKGLTRIISNVVDSYFNEMLDRQMSLLEIIIELLKIIVDKNPTIVLDDNTLVGKLIDKINIALNQKQIESERGL